jgi:Protein of unknown function (DUF3105)
VVAVVALVLVCGCVLSGVFWFRSIDLGKPDSDTGASQVVDYRKTNPAALTRDHKLGRISYPMSPPAGGPHNPIWQNCEGNVYEAPIASEHAVHSLEHGAVWITYRPDLPRDQVDALANRVRGSEYLLMSPYPGLDRPISLQAWGYQLKVDSASDKAIDAFIATYRRNASLEPGAPCGAGITTTGTEPLPR